MKNTGADIISQTVGTSTTYLGYDGHGSTRTLTDAVGAVTNTFHFDGYGMDLGWGRDTDVEYNQVNKPATDMLYSGEQYDTPLQMQYLRARYYDQNVGGFNRRDPWRGATRDPQSLHKYAYTHSDPINGIDPSGRSMLIDILSATAATVTWKTLAIGAAIGGATSGAFKLFEQMAKSDYSVLSSKFWNAEVVIDLFEAIFVGAVLGALGGIFSKLGTAIRFVSQQNMWNAFYHFIGIAGIPGALTALAASIIDIYQQILNGVKLSWKEIMVKFGISLVLSVSFAALSQTAEDVGEDLLLETIKKKDVYKQAFEKAMKGGNSPTRMGDVLRMVAGEKAVHENISSLFTALNGAFGGALLSFTQGIFEKHMKE